jgi:hypothetical protein
MFFTIIFNVISKKWAVRLKKRSFRSLYVTILYKSAIYNKLIEPL